MVLNAFTTPALAGAALATSCAIEVSSRWASPSAAELPVRAGRELVTLPDVGEPVPGVELGDLIVSENAEQPFAVRFGDLP